ncbi:hypothetical protein [Dyadobacter sp. CY312]|uniref:hypothetical protein n=1 Tax=Dyadobacter sp. CY312 TaxID=2907303 RepID=UPI001F48E33A|nr:hypothetical protein [Dyadobacter sp. CY312]MCE7043824.1 hypothetical protein [Dyadobacter sp. CY312]
MKARAYLLSSVALIFGANLFGSTETLSRDVTIVLDTSDTRGNLRRADDPTLFLRRFLDPSFIVGNGEEKDQSLNAERWMNLEVEPPNLTALETNSKQSPFLVFGDGLAAGWKDGGLYRAGQQLSFPNLLAHQMGISNFNSPLFDLEHRNGTGYLIAERSNSGPRWKEITNNLASVNFSDIPEFEPYDGEEAENLAFPRISRGSISGILSPNENGWIFDEFGRRYTDDMPFLWRLAPEAKKNRSTYWDMALNKINVKQPAIVMSVFGFDEMMEENLENKHVKMSWGMASSETSPLTILLADQAKRAGAIGVVFTIPDFRHLPYFNWFTKSKLDQINPNIKLTLSRENILGVREIAGDMVFLPTQNVEFVFKNAKEGRGAEFPLLDTDVADHEELVGGSSELINLRIKREAKEKGLIVVDLADLYKRIYEGDFKSKDGYLIDGGVNGNFFSSDGIYPSSIGNAVIANEAIEVLNDTFNAKIKLIDITQFVKIIEN